jgi:hypothetical protein
VGARRLVVAAGAFALLATACGGGGGRSAVAVLTGVPARTIAARSSRVAFAMDIPANPNVPPAAPVRVTGEGVFEYGAKKGRMTLDLSAAGLPGKVETIVDGTIVYERLPASLAGKVPGGKPWIKVDQRVLSQRAGLDVNSLSQAQSDPTQALEYLKGTSGDLRELGRQRLRGESTTRYALTIDLEKALANTPEAKETLQSFRKLLGTTTIPAEVWVDDAGRMRKLQLRLDLSKSSDPAASRYGGPLTMTVELFDFGTAVDAALPPADQVTDIGALVGQAGGG